MGELSPRLLRPRHFAHYCSRIEAGVGGDLRIVFAAPPQHGKTECTLHGLVWLILKFPHLRHAYVTYGLKRAQRVAKKVKKLLALAGVVVSGTLDTMEFPGGGQCIFTSIDGGITGEPVDGVVIIDDPIKNRQEADSESRRQVILDSYRDAIEPRVHPGASVIVLATRWHPEDLSGTLIKEGWEYIGLPAIAEENDPNGREIGEALFPGMWSIKSLQRKRANILDFTWSALYQCRPRPRGGKIFHEATYYKALPTRCRGAYGVDLAYTAKTSADWSVCIGMLREENALDKKRPFYYVVRIDRQQVKAPEFALTLKARHTRQPKWPMLWRASGTEKGSADFIRAKDIPLMVDPPPGDKFVAATPVAEAWNDGRVLLPDADEFIDEDGRARDGFEWMKTHLDAFLDVVGNFTGTGDETDDDVDALGNAYTELARRHDLSGVLDDDDFEEDNGNDDDRPRGGGRGWS